MEKEIIETTVLVNKEPTESLEIKDEGFLQPLKLDTTYRIVNGWLVRWDGVPIRKL